MANSNPPRRIRVAQLITGLGAGGAEMVVYNLSKSLNKQHFSNRVISLSNNTEILPRFRQRGIDVKVFNMKKGPLSFLSTMLKIYRDIQKNQVDIIHAHMVHAGIVGGIFKVLNPKLKIVFTSHNDNLESRLREFLIWATRVLRSVDIIFSKKRIPYFIKRKPKVIPNGIDPQVFRRDLQDRRTFRFILVARFEPQKNHSDLIDAIYEIKHLDFEVLLVGDGSLKPEIEAKVRRLELNQKVKFLGRRDDIPDLLANADCMLLPSLWEGLPICVLEAGASSLPVIATPVGHLDQILNKENSYFREIQNFPQAMRHVIENPEEARLKGDKLRKMVEGHFSVSQNVEKHENIYKGCLNNFNALKPRRNKHIFSY